MNVPSEDAHKARLAAGMTPYMADALSELFAERRAGKESKVWPTISDVFGWRPTSFEEFARRNAAIFRGERDRRQESEPERPHPGDGQIPGPVGDGAAVPSVRSTPRTVLDTLVCKGGSP